MRFLALFLLVPLLEVVMFIQVGGQIGALWTILLTLGTAITGSILIRSQGIKTFSSARTQLAQGEIPAMAVVEGIMLLLAGVMLMTPGFITDALGALVLVPPFRQYLAGSVLQKVFVARAGQTTRTEAGNTIEGQFHREDD